MIDPQLPHDGEGAVTTRTLRQFAALWLAVFGGLTLWQWSANGNSVATWVLAVLAVAVGPLGIVNPSAVRPLFSALVMLTHPIGWIVSNLIIVLLYFLIFSPLALFFKLIGRDPLVLRRPRNADTYWTSKSFPTDLRSYTRPS